MYIVEKQREFYNLYRTIGGKPEIWPCASTNHFVSNKTLDVTNVSGLIKSIRTKKSVTVEEIDNVFVITGVEK